MTQKKTASWPRQIIEVSTSSARATDSRSDDPNSTQKISKSELEEALRRTKSGLRRAVRESGPDAELERDPFAEPAGDMAPAGAAAEAFAAAQTQLQSPTPTAPEIAMPDPIITIKQDDDGVNEDMLGADELPRGVPIPRTRGSRVMTPASGVVVLGPAPSRLPRVLLALLVAALTIAALAIGYLAGRGSLLH